MEVGSSRMVTISVSGPSLRVHGTCFLRGLHKRTVLCGSTEAFGRSRGADSRGSVVAQSHTH